ncbi:MAG: hypothetical protein JXA08_07685, partial [Methanomicrobiaceae archaeon]|nr:hypothetical protein [Methanomicrobiaceae archaeon]
GKCRTYIALGDASSGQEALGYYDEALALRPGRLDALIGKARILSSSSTYEAIQCYEKILTLSPDHKEARTELYALCDRMRPATSLLSSSGNRFFNSRVIESNQLEIDNSEGLRDVQAILIDSQYNTLGSHHKYVVYLRSGEKYTIYKIPGGTYNLFFSTGEHWNPNTQKFMESVRYRKFEEDLQFTSFSFRYSMISVTLYSVPGGTAAIVPVPENQFP